ncbi:hypothetical protein [Streptomyces johnsoniae]|uniref:Uncharacterized protein n=1 Tax=Streptomyces johnsoniae TaxID=3075532 RepID=A0ABU2SFZ0_9ACTN|nr:hypothetical protein [Streptomyces sp. DSM 41886]MDT0446804.1 hypothetical protein [Streptomyces sp. DSM 41886]
MASRHDIATQERRRRLRERQEHERKEVRRRQQAQKAALSEIDTAVARLEDARAAVAAAVARAGEVFPSNEALADLTPFDVREIRAFQRLHRQTERATVVAPRADEPTPVS